MLISRPQASHLALQIHQTPPCLLHPHRPRRRAESGGGRLSTTRCWFGTQCEVTLESCRLRAGRRRKSNHRLCVLHQRQTAIALRQKHRWRRAPDHNRRSTGIPRCDCAGLARVQRTKRSLAPASRLPDSAGPAQRSHSHLLSGQRK